MSCKLLPCCCLILVLLAPGTHSEAALFEADWLAPGDGLLTIDPNTGLQWLDLSETDLADFPPGDTFEARLQNVVAQTAPGGRFHGFQVATEEQTEELIASAGVIDRVIDVAVNGEPVRRLIELLSPTEQGPGGILRISGAALQDVVPLSGGRFTRLGLVANYEPAFRASALVGSSFSSSSEIPNPDGGASVLLVRLPEPSSLMLIAATVVLSFSRRLVI